MRIETRFQRSAWYAIALLSVSAFLGPPPTASGAERVALVVGNSTYAHIGRLPNPENDAADVTAALRRLGFEVTTVSNATRAELNASLRGFSRQSAGAVVALVFYAGHGMEMDGVNYLLPVDARLERDTDVRYETVTLDDVLAATTGAGLRMVILDACRNNPLARSMQRTATSRSVSRGSFGALDEDLLGDETLVAYAAAAGTTADDGTGRNSPYTAALLEHLEEPLEVSMLFRRVRARVLDVTDQRQRPHEYQSLLGEHYLRGASVPTAIVGNDATASDAGLMQRENLYWQTIADSNYPEDFRAYMEEYPNGAYVRLAANRLAALASAAGDSPVDVETAGGPASRPFLSRPFAGEGVSQTAALSALLGRGLSASRSDENGWTDLHYAAVLNLPDAVRHLVERGADTNDGIKRDGRPLDSGLRRVLDRAGHDFDSWTRDGETPLHVAAAVGAREAAIELLASGADGDAGTKFDWRPLHYAAWANASDVVEVLLVHGADLDAETDEVDQPGRTPLQIAVQTDSDEAAAVLRASEVR